MDSIVSSSNPKNFRSNSLNNDFLPRYPLELEPGTFVMPEEINPDIIEGPPNNVDDIVGAKHDEQHEVGQNDEVTRIHNQFQLFYENVSYLKCFFFSPTLLFLAN